MTPRRRRLWIAALSLWSLAVVVHLFYYLPPVWPDEAMFGDTAYSLATGKGFATPALGDQIPGAAQHLVWQPPVHTAVVAGTFRAFGPGVERMRAVSLAAALVLLVAVWRIGSRMAGALAAAIAVTLLVADARFLRAAIVGRNDVLAMALVFLALWRGSGVWSGIFAGLALATHNAGGIAAAAIGLDMVVARAGIRPLARFALGVLIGVAPWALQIAMDPPVFLEQFLLQITRDSTPAGWNIAQVTWNLDSRLPVALAIWATYAAGAVSLARMRPNADARRLLIAALLGLALNLLRPEVTYVPWMAIPAAMGLGAMAARARAPFGIARVAVVALVAVHAAYVAALAVRARALDYPAFAASMRHCVADAAPDATRLLIDSLPEVYLSMLDHRERIAIRVPSPVSDVASRRALLANTDAVLLGPIAWEPSWPLDVNADAAAWRLIPLAESGGYRTTLAVRAGVDFPLPAECGR